MNYLKRLLLASLTLCLALGFISAAREEFFPPTPAPVIWEDDPRWDCATMGNTTCAPRAEVLCADTLGITWDVDNGATERLSEWAACLAGVAAARA